MAAQQKKIEKASDSGVSNDENKPDLSGKKPRAGKPKKISPNAVQDVNGFVMNAGDVFSYNDAVGQRTAENGYQPAPAYVKGETVDEIGGGICQTSPF